MKISVKIKLILTALVCLTIGACEDWMELIPPDGLVKDEFWQSKEDINAVLMGAYQKFAQLDERLFLYGELRGGMITDDNNTAGYQRLIMEGNIYPDNVLCDWEDFYLVINYCNYVLKYTDIVMEFDDTFTEFQKRAFEAEAVFLRSLAYFYLVRIFKDVPFVLDPSEEDDIDFYLPKTADTIILSGIKSDLEEVRSFVRDDYGTSYDNKGRANKGAFLALLADISLWNFEYNEVIKYTEAIEPMDYLLLPGGKWFENFYPGNSQESIFEFQFDAGLDQNNNLYDYTYFNNQRYRASSSALELLSLEISKEIIRGPGSLRASDAAIWKYSGAAADGKTFRPSAERRDANWIVYRYADVLLMKAEALSQTGRFGEALDIINEIRTRALNNPISVSYSAEALEDAILEERAKEFAFEGKRWFDLMRMGRRNNYDRRKDLVEIIVQKVPSTQRLVLASKLNDPLGWYLPIEENELERNNNLVQNPYYAEFSSD